jgi:hypothetical protein
MRFPAGARLGPYRTASSGPARWARCRRCVDNRRELRERCFDGRFSATDRSATAAKPAPASRSSSVNAVPSEHRQLPGVGSLVVADEIRVAVRASQFEVPTVGRQPRVEQFRNGNAPVTQDQRAWRLLAAMAGVTLDANADEAFFRQVRSPHGVAAQNRSRRRQIRVAAHEAPQSVSRHDMASGLLPWRLSWEI